MLYQFAHGALQQVEVNFGLSALGIQCFEAICEIQNNHHMYRY